MDLSQIEDYVSLNLKIPAQKQEWSALIHGDERFVPDFNDQTEVMTYRYDDTIDGCII